MELFLQHVILEVDADADKDAVSNFLVEGFINVEKSEKCQNLIAKGRIPATASTDDTLLLRTTETNEREAASERYDYERD